MSFVVSAWRGIYGIGPILSCTANGAGYVVKSCNLCFVVVILS